MENRSLQRILRKRKDNLNAQQKYKYSQMRCAIQYLRQPAYKSRHKWTSRNWNYYPAFSGKQKKAKAVKNGSAGKAVAAAFKLEHNVETLTA